jgi:hypothetical protein
MTAARSPFSGSTQGDLNTVSNVSPSPQVLNPFILLMAIYLTGFVLTLPWIDDFFGFSSLPFPIILIIGGLVIIYLLLVELIKQIFYRKFYIEEKYNLLFDILLK